MTRKLFAAAHDWVVWREPFRLVGPLLVALVVLSGLNWFRVVMLRPPSIPRECRDYLASPGVPCESRADLTVLNGVALCLCGGKR